MLQYGTTSASLGTSEQLVFPTDDIFSRRTGKAQCRSVRTIHGLSESQSCNWAIGQCDQFVDDGLVDDIVEVWAACGIGVARRDDTRIGPLVVVDDGTAS